MQNFTLKEFKPTILFLAKFIGIYLIGNLLYGFYVTAYKPDPDPVTQWVTEQTATTLNIIGYTVIATDHPTRPTTLLSLENRNIVSIYEGCNGINVFIIFIAFVVAFGPFQKTMAWFIPLGVLIIHFFNLLRIGGLFLVVLYIPEFLYFTHKYLFTAFIYLIVFLLWIWWVKNYTRKITEHASK